jgi:hypothetical protein
MLILYIVHSKDWVISTLATIVCALIELQFGCVPSKLSYEKKLIEERGGALWTIMHFANCYLLSLDIWLY